MPDKYDPEIQKLVEDIHTDISRISSSIEEIKSALAHMTAQRPLMAQRNAATNGPFRSGRWTLQDGTFPAGASGITPGPQNADSASGDLRSPIKR